MVWYAHVGGLSDGPMADGPVSGDGPGLARGLGARLGDPGRLAHQEHQVHPRLNTQSGGPSSFSLRFGINECVNGVLYLTFYKNTYERIGGIEKLNNVLFLRRSCYIFALL